MNVNFKLIMSTLNELMTNCNENKCKSGALKVAGGVAWVYLHVHWFLCMYTGFCACTLVYVHVHWFLFMYTGWAKKQNIERIVFDA